MPTLIRPTLAFSALAIGASVTHAQLRIATYNTETAFNPNGAPNPGLSTVLQGIGNEGVNGITKRIDILCLQEQNNNTGTTTLSILSTMNSLYGAGTYAKGQLISGSTVNPNNDSSGVVYDTTRLQLISEALIGTPSTSGMPRQEIRYQFRPIGYSASSDFYVYVGHWKANGGTDDMNRRNVEAQTLRANANTLAAASRILYVGDFNLTGGTSEPAWTTITAAGDGQGIDPKSGSWATANQTWSTTSIGSRLDFQMNTPPTMDGHGFSLINNSYHTFGNDGSIGGGGAANDASNTVFPGLPNRTAVLNALTTASDHYPVIADYRIPAKMSVSLSAAPAQVIVGANAVVSASVTNSAPVSFAIGADTLDYAYSSSGNLTGSGNASGLAALAPANVHNFTFDTSVPGIKSGTANVVSSSQEVANGSFSQNVSTTVLAHANGSFAPASNQDSLTIDLGIRARGESVPAQLFSVYNLADPSGFTARLDLDSVIGFGSVTMLSANVAPFSNLVAGGSVSFSTALNTSTTGSFTTSYTLNLSDEDLPGATTLTSMTLNLAARVALAGDANLDGTVNVSDFSILASHFGLSGQSWLTADFNHDGVVNVGDFGLLAGNFGLTGAPDGPTPQDWANLAAVVPEPASLPLAFAALAAATLAHSRRRRHKILALEPLAFSGVVK